MIALRVWKLEGHPQVGWWVKVGDDTLDFEGGYTLKIDWYPHSLDSELMPTHKMKDRAYWFLRLPQGGGKELFHRQLVQD